MRTFFTGLVFCLLLTSGLSAQNRFLLDPVSQLKIHGKSNVNVFTCTCRQIFHPLPFRLDASRQQDRLGFRHTLLRVQTQLFDCGNKVMNRDLYNALRADDYPEMTIELDAVEIPGSLSPAWSDVRVWTRITLAGVTQHIWLDAKVRQPADKQWQIRAGKALRMTDFRITPPTALMGMIRTYDEIRIELDLLIHWLP